MSFVEAAQIKGGSSHLKRSRIKVGLPTLNYLIKKNKPLAVLVHSRYSHVGDSRQADTTTSYHLIISSGFLIQVYFGSCCG